MRKQQYIATVACLVAGVIGFVSVYATDKGKERREAEQEIAAQTQQEAPASYEVKPEISVEDATKKSGRTGVKAGRAGKNETGRNTAGGREETGRRKNSRDSSHRDTAF